MLLFTQMEVHISLGLREGTSGDLPATKNGQQRSSVKHKPKRLTKMWHSMQKKTKKTPFMATTQHLVLMVGHIVHFLFNSKYFKILFKIKTQISFCEEICILIQKGDTLCCYVMCTNLSLWFITFFFFSWLYLRDSTTNGVAKLRKSDTDGTALFSKNGLRWLGGYLAGKKIFFRGYISEKNSRTTHWYYSKACYLHIYRFKGSHV